MHSGRRVHGLFGLNGSVARVDHRTHRTPHARAKGVRHVRMRDLPPPSRRARLAARAAGRLRVGAATRALVDVEVSDLGAHRLKDLSAPERLYQLDDRTFPLLKTLSNTNLPIPATPFLGRVRAPRRGRSPAARRCSVAHVDRRRRQWEDARGSAGSDELACASAGCNRGYVVRGAFALAVEAVEALHVPLRL
jgi:hypothetical protein